MQASPSTTSSRLNHPRARNLLALVSALLLTLLFGVSHASAAVHAKSRSHKAASSKAHKRAAVNRKSKKHSTKGVKSSKKKSKKRPTSSSTNNTTTSTKSGTTSSTASTSGTTSTGSSSTGFSPASTSTSTGSTLFDGTLPSAWWLNQSAYSTRVQMVPNPAGGTGTVQQFTTLNSDVAPLTPTFNPRSQLTGPQNILKPGNTYWTSYEVYIPTTDNLPMNNTWLGLGAIAYGAPFNGGPPVGLSIWSGKFRFQRNQYGAYPYQIAWTAPVVKGQWYRFTWHYLFSAQGWVQLYVNDVLQNLKAGSSTVTQLPVGLIDPTDNKGPWEPQEQLYYQLNAMSSVQADFQNYKVATTQAAAES